MAATEQKISVLSLRKPSQVHGIEPGLQLLSCAMTQSMPAIVSIQFKHFFVITRCRSVVSFN